MLITAFNFKKIYQSGGCAVAVLVLSITGSVFTPTSAEEECATDFVSQKTCRLFDTLERGLRESSNAQRSAVGAALWDDHSGFFGSQIWYRNRFDGNSMSTKPRGREILGNRAIHGIPCLTDLFGNVVCNQDQLTPEVPQDKKPPNQK